MIQSSQHSNQPEINMTQAINHRVSNGWFKNCEIYTFRIIGDVPQDIKQLLGAHKHVTEAGDVTWIKELVTQCDYTNPHNPSQNQVERNRKIVAALLAAGSSQMVVS